MICDVRPSRLLAKAVIIFALLNVAFAGLDPTVERLSVFNWFLPGRLRLPIHVDDLQASFNAHVISGLPKDSGEYRILLLGDSQTWGLRLPVQQSLGQQMNAMHLSACGRKLRFYNLALPFASALRDFFVLSESLKYEPDSVVWLLTLNSFLPRAEPLDPVKAQSQAAVSLLEQYALGRYRDLVGPIPSFLGRTPTAEAGRLHRLALLQLDGMRWTAGMIDFDTSPYEPQKSGVLDDPTWEGFAPPELDPAQLFFDVVGPMHRLAGGLPVLVISEPMFIAQGRNSAIRYNVQYPRWAYDQYLALLQRAAAEQGWPYMDLHALVADSDFTDVPQHLNAEGEKQLAQAIAPTILRMACP